MNREELAWAAGLFDGEGWVGPAQHRTQLSARIAQIDRYVLDRFRAAVGVGNVTGPRTLKGRTHQPIFEYCAGSFHATQAVMAMLWQWLSPVKRRQYARAVASIQLRRAKSSGECKRGHHLSGANLKIGKWAGRLTRVCRACSNASDRERCMVRRVAHALLVAI